MHGQHFWPCIQRTILHFTIYSHIYTYNKRHQMSRNTFTQTSAGTRLFLHNFDNFKSVQRPRSNLFNQLTSLSPGLWPDFYTPYVTLKVFSRSKTQLLPLKNCMDRPWRKNDPWPLVIKKGPKSFQSLPGINPVAAGSRHTSVTKRWFPPLNLCSLRSPTSVLN